MLQTKQPHIRIAITPHCNLNCIYCRPGGEGIASNGNLITKEEIISLAKIASDVGFKHIKFTGGEPLIRKDVLEIVRGVKDSSDFLSRYMITNGVYLNGKAKPLKDSGLDHIVVSLDVATPERFVAVNGGKKDNFYDVIKGIEDCVVNNLPVTINTVLMRRNLDQLEGLTQIAANYGAKLKLIDLMEVKDGDNTFWKEQFVPFSEIEELLTGLSKSTDLEKPIGNLGATMKSYKLKNGALVITRDAMMGAFYHESCNPCKSYPCQDAVYGARITHDGKLKRCLIRDDNLVDVLSDLRTGKNEKVYAKMADFFRIFNASVYQNNAWRPKN